MKINVTAEHIKKGRRGHCMKCPVARAILEEFKKRGVKVKTLSVYDDFVNVYAGVHLKVQTMNFSNRVTQFIQNFDLVGGKVKRKAPKPFSFMLPYKVKK